jgi:hypothetical protein
MPLRVLAAGDLPTGIHSYRMVAPAGASIVAVSVIDHPGTLPREAFRRAGFRPRLLASRSGAAGAARRVPLCSCWRMGVAFVHGGGVAAGGIKPGHCRRGQQRPRRRLAALLAGLRLLELRHRPDGGEWATGGAEIVIDWHCEFPVGTPIGCMRRRKVVSPSWSKVVSLSSWPGVSRPSAPHCCSADGQHTSGRDG